MIGGAQELIREQVWNQRFGQHSTPVGGGNAPIRCLLTANKKQRGRRRSSSRRRRCSKNGGVGGGGRRLGPESCQRHHECIQEEPQHVSTVGCEQTALGPQACFTRSGSKARPRLIQGSNYGRGLLPGIGTV